MTDHDITTETNRPATPSVREKLLDTLRENPRGLSTDLLVATVTHRADASRELVKTTLERLRKEGEVYRVNDEYKVTRL